MKKGENPAFGGSFCCPCGGWLDSIVYCSISSPPAYKCNICPREFPFDRRGVPYLQPYVDVIDGMVEYHKSAVQALERMKEQVVQSLNPNDPRCRGLEILNE